MRHGITIAILAAVISSGGTAHAQSKPSAIRPEHGSIRVLIASATERSETFRGLVATLEKGDIVVYVRYAPCSRGVSACLILVAPGAVPRRLLIKLDRFGRSRDELVTLLAHEFQHANELAAAPNVVDIESFGKLFSSLGWSHGSGFETADAKAVARKVARELADRRGAR